MARPATPPARPRRAADAADADAALSRALVRALGEFAAFARGAGRSRRRRGAQAAEERQAVVAWLRARSVGELASLCSMEDGVFVKTVLSMAMAASRLAGRARKGAVQLGGGQVAEFQILPMTGPRAKLATRRRRAGEPVQTPQTQAPREFVARPLVRTADGDVFGAFHTREYRNAVQKVSNALYFYNTHKSCDTVSLSLESLGVVSKDTNGRSTGTNVDVLVALFSAISGGAFLYCAPSEATLSDRVWGETKWLSSQGYYSLEALIVNQIELNIWNHWYAAKASPNDAVSITMIGPATKQYLVHEWNQSSTSDRCRVLRELHARVVDHLQGSCTSTPNRLFQSAKASLAHLVDLVSLDQDHESKKSSLIVERLFGCQLKQIIAAPQVAALKFLVSEHLQARCSMLLSERIASEATALNQFTASTEREGESNHPENHSQRRRASRKKILKQRRQDSIVKAAQQQQLKLVHVELLAQYRRRREESVRIASGILNDLIGRTVDSAKGESIYPSPSKLVLGDVAGSIAKKKKKSKKKAKKKKKSSEPISTTFDNAALQGNKNKDLVEAGASSAGSTPTSKENMSLEGNASRRNPSKSETTGDRTLVGTQRLQQQGLLYSASSEPRPFLGFLSSVNVATSLTTFSPRPFYPTVPSTFFSPLAIRGHDAYPAGNQEGKMQHKVDDSERASSDVSSDSLGNDSLSISDQSSFDWRLPSMFSTPTAPDREQSTISPLDWNFYNYRWPLPSDVGGEGSSDSDQSATNSDGGRGQVTYSGRDDESGSYPLRSFPTAPVVESGLGGGRTRTFSDADERGFSMKSNNYHDEDEELSPSDPIVTKSDFLYRKGGFFDRQRTLKHRRQPHLDTNATEPSPSGARTSTAIASAANIETVYENDEDHSERLSRCHKCCSCDCHKRSSSEDTALSTDCTQHSAIEAALQSDLKETRSELSSVIERISKLEKDFIDQIAHAKTLATDAIKDAGSLQQTVSTLSSQLQAAESEIRTLQSMYRSSVPGSSFNCDDQASVIMEECGAASGLETSADSSVSSLGPSFSPAPSSDSHMSEGSAIARSNANAGTAGRMMDYNYPHSLVSHPSIAPSAMGPFVSVPMSVLPPRSKLHWDMCEFVSQLQSESNARLPAQMEAQRLCTATVQSLWPRAQVRPYGSYVTRLVLPSSDVDLVICLPKVRRDAPADTAGVLEGRNAIKETWQQNLARKLRQEPWVVPDSVKTLPHASVPIITLLTAPPYNVRLDISFEGPGHNGLATNDVVLSLIHEFPPLAPIMLVLKSFAIERGFAIAYSGGLSSYALLLMVARYLQEYNDTLPNGFENVSAAVQHSISAQSAADFGMMLMGFLDFYGNRFDPRTTGISVASRSFLNRETMAPSSSTSPSGSSAVAVQHSSRDGGSNSMEHWQNMPPPPPPPIDLLSSPGSRRYGYRSSLDWPQNPTSTGDMMNMMVRGEYYPANAHVDPHKFDPVFIEDPLRPSNNVGRNCFRIMQIRRAFAAAHNALALASRSSAVFSENRSAVIAGVVLHPDNLLRAVLGANAPVNIKSETAMSADPSGNVGGPAPSPRQTPHSMRQNYIRFQHHVATSEGVPFGSPQPVATHYFGGEGGYPVVHPDQLHPATHLHHHYQQPYRFRGSNSVNHYRHQPHQTHHDDYMIDHASARGGNSYHHEYTSPHRLHEPTSRRYSESESERLTTRSVTSADQYERVQRRERSVGSPRRKSRSTAASQPRLGSVGGKPSTFEDHVPNARHHRTDHGPQNIATRKSPARSLSFADVVVGGSGNARQRTSPLALARQGRYWRDDSAINDSISEKWETKDDSQLK